MLFFLLGQRWQRKNNLEKNHFHYTVSLWAFFFFWKRERKKTFASLSTCLQPPHTPLSPRRVNFSIPSPPHRSSYKTATLLCCILLLSRKIRPKKRKIPDFSIRMKLAQIKLLFLPQTVVGWGSICKFSGGFFCSRLS